MLDFNNKEIETTNNYDEFSDPIDQQRLKQFETMTQEQLEIYAMNLKDNDEHVRPLLTTQINGMPVNVFGHPASK